MDLVVHRELHAEKKQWDSKVGLKDAMPKSRQIHEVHRRAGQSKSNEIHDRACSPKEAPSVHWPQRCKSTLVCTEDLQVVHLHRLTEKLPLRAGQRELAK